jgi:23S rRNA pseudouridine2604 synthase
MEKPLSRLSKIMSERGICSRREAEAFIESGQVLVDGQIISVQGTKVSPDAHIELLSHARKMQTNKVTILLHKPVGYVSTQPEKGYRPAIELITPENQVRKDDDMEFSYSHLRKLSVVGRLDIDSKGLLVLTQDGVIAKKIIGPLSNMEKEYMVYIEGTITEAAIERLRFGLSLDDKSLKPVYVELCKPDLLRFILKEGKKRQIRRMCELVGVQVVGLKRVRIGKVQLGELPIGKWRFMRSDESF